MKVNWTSAVVMMSCIAAVTVLIAVGRNDLAALMGVVTPVLNSVMPSVLEKKP